MTLALARPEVIGTLTPAEATMFSSDFSINPDAIPPSQRLINPEDMLLFDRYTEQKGIALPETHSQFLPAICIAVENEKTVRGNRRLERAILTTRQSVVQPGRSQQGGSGNGVHRDSAKPDEFFTVADTHPPQYYPNIGDDARDMRGAIRITDEEIAQGITFDPFEIVRASTMVYHRSPRVAAPTRRTFLRLTFFYDHPTRY